jgi:hypothetical protein
MFIRTTLEPEAEGKLRGIYESDRKSLGYVPNHATVFSLRRMSLSVDIRPAPP